MLDELVEPTGCEYDGVLLLEELLLDGVEVEEPLLVLEVLSVLEAGGVEVDDGVVLDGVDEGEVVLDGVCVLFGSGVPDGDVLEGCCEVVSVLLDGVVVLDGDVVVGDVVLEGLAVLCWSVVDVVEFGVC